jgi:hypothetical protein
VEELGALLPPRRICDPQAKQDTVLYIAAPNPATLRPWARMLVANTVGISCFGKQILVKFNA